MIDAGFCRAESPSKEIEEFGYPDFGRMMEVSVGIFAMEVSKVMIPVLDTFNVDFNSLLNQNGNGNEIEEVHLGVLSDAL